MKKLIALFVVIFVIALPLIALKAERDARAAAERPIVGVRVSEAEMSGGMPANAVAHAESSDTLPPLTAQECIVALNANYKQMWASNLTDYPQTPKAAAPTVRYAISDEERREIERIVASEGGYCEYRFQALVADFLKIGSEIKC